MTDLDFLYTLAFMFLLGMLSWVSEVGWRGVWRELGERWKDFRKARKKMQEEERLADWPPKRPNSDN